MAVEVRAVHVTFDIIYPALAEEPDVYPQFALTACAY